MAISLPGHRRAWRARGFLLTAKRDRDAARRFFRKAREDLPLIGPHKIGMDGANVYPRAVFDTAEAGLMPGAPTHRVSKHLQQGVQSNLFRVGMNMPKIRGFQWFASAKRSIAGIEAKLWLKKGFGFADEGTVHTRNELLVWCFGLQMVDLARTSGVPRVFCDHDGNLRQALFPKHSDRKALCLFSEAW